MTTDEFADLTRRMIAKDGLEGFLPTTCWPGRREVATLQDVPNEVDLEHAALQWATGRSSAGEEFLLAFRYGAAGFKVIRRSATGVEAKTYTLEG
jgi:hypothetical protein